MCGLEKRAVHGVLGDILAGPRWFVRVPRGQVKVCVVWVSCWPRKDGIGSSVLLAQMEGCASILAWWLLLGYLGPCEFSLGLGRFWLGLVGAGIGLSVTGVDGLAEGNSEVGRVRKVYWPSIFQNFSNRFFMV